MKSNSQIKRGIMQKSVHQKVWNQCVSMGLTMGIPNLETAPLEVLEKVVKYTRGVDKRTWRDRWPVEFKEAGLWKGPIKHSQSNSWVLPKKPNPNL